MIGKKCGYFNHWLRLNKSYYESIELNFMIPGYTKFKCDSSFGLIKNFTGKLLSIAWIILLK